MRIVVMRGAGENPAPDEQVHELATGEAAGTQLGRNYLDARGSAKRVYEIEAAHAGALALPGDVAEVEDADIGERFRGLVTGTSLEIAVGDDGAVALTQKYAVERSLA
jgi:hypothetical protein